MEELKLLAQLNSKLNSSLDKQASLSEACLSCFKVRVTADSLNYRAGAGVKYKINGTITDKGVYTIVNQLNGWGKLKSGAGWINLKYTKRI